MTNANPFQNQNIILNVGDEIGFVQTASSIDSNDTVVFFPVVEITERDGERAYLYAYPDGEVCRAAIRQSQLSSHVIKVRRVVQITPAAQTEMICLSERRREFIDAMTRAENSDLEVFNDWEKDCFVVVNHDNNKEYKVNFRTETGRLFSDCECADFVYRKRVCKHISAVLTYTLFGLMAKN